ncbi:MAG: cytochrome C oxidase subunit IV family protein [Flavobacteriales bacterium]
MVDKGTAAIWKVFIVLSIVTLAEVLLGIYRPEFLTVEIFSGLISLLDLTFILLTLYKAYCIVWFFMHMKHEYSNLRLTITLPLYILVPYLIFILLVESTYVRDILKL